MTCDDAFDLMTDPFGRGSLDLKRHLETCRRCRQMREILSPALALFEQHVAEPAEFPAGADCDTLFEQWDDICTSDFLSTESMEIAERAALELAESIPAPRRTQRHVWQRAAGYAAACLVGAALALGMYGWRSHDDAPPAVVPGDMAWQECTWLQRDQIADDAPRSQDLVLSCVVCHLQSHGH